MGQALEEMRMALEGKHYIENYVQNLTHEIKSPLTGIMAATEILQEKSIEQDKFLNNIMHGSKRIQSIVDRLMSLIKLEKLEYLEHVETIELEALLQDVLKGFSAQLEQKNINCMFESKFNKTVKGDPLLLRQAIQNIIQNAIEFMPEKGELKISLDDQGSSFILKFSDNGAGIPDYALNKVFDRFYSLPRPHQNKKSTGLGLNFVKEVMKLHNAKVWLENNADKNGTSVYLEFFI